MADSLTFPKLFVLYMLRQADFPVTGSHIDECLLNGDYISYFDLKAALDELARSGLIRAQSRGTITYYTITAVGQDTLAPLAGDIPASIQTDIRAFMKENRERMRDESSVFAEYERQSNGEYEVRCRAVENNSDLIRLSITVPDEDQARTACLRWVTRCQPIYEFVMQNLLSQA